jgi:glucosamine--fructose-6-phosphate aminotransferase (isomerizing)
VCGIFGVVVRDERPLGDLLLTAGRRLAYRGYDSIGCATLSPSREIDLRKDVGRIDDVDSRLRFSEMTGNRGMVQLRWATFGAPSHENAQPHLDSEGHLVGAHNGNIVNHAALRASFLAEGMIVRGTNDGESCVHAVERYMRRGSALAEAIRRAARDLEGDYAYVIGQRSSGDGKADPCLYAVKQGSGLVAGLGDEGTFVSSDLPSILPFTRRIVRLEDGEMVTLWHDRIELRRIEDGALVTREPEIHTEDMATAEKGGYAHFMLKEIHEQPKVAGDLLHLLRVSPHVSPFLDRVRNGRRVYLVACGSSHHACVFGAALLNRWASIPAVAVLAPQFCETLVHTLRAEDVVILVSQSGETKDVLNAHRAARPSGAAILGVLNVIGSALMHASDLYLPLACGYEISVPATKTFLNQALLFLYLAARLAPGPDTADWDRLPGLIETTLAAVDAPARRLAERLAPHAESYILGYGLTLATALEGALKLKEITYLHSEALLSSEFKHGPLSAVQDGYPVVFVAAPCDGAMITNHVNEVACRGGRTVVIGAEDDRLRDSVDDFIALPHDADAVVAMLAVLPLQLASYHLSVLRGVDPDFPRNLSKTLTVD